MTWKAVGLAITALIYALIGAVLGFTLAYAVVRLGVLFVEGSQSVHRAAGWAPLAGAVLAGAAAAAGYLRSERRRG